MPICDICNSRVGFFEIVRLSDGKCCERCMNSSLGDRKSIAEIKNGILGKKSWEIVIRRMESFFYEQYSNIGLNFNRNGPDIANAVKLDILGNTYLTLHNNDLCFIEGWNHYYTKYSNFMRCTDVSRAETVVFDDLKLTKISVDCVSHYCKEGDRQYTTNIHGGGGGGTSITGAIIGGLIAGEAGAVIGSRKQTAPITSTTQVHDSRKTYLAYFHEEKLITIEIQGHEVYNYLLKKIPQKDFKVVQLQSTNSKAGSTADEIRKFKELLDDGIITQEEFDVKKKQLLGL